MYLLCLPLMLLRVAAAAARTNEQTDSTDSSSFSLRGLWRQMQGKSGGELFFIWVKTVGEGKARGRVRIGEGN